MLEGKVGEVVRLIIREVTFAFSLTSLIYQH